MADDTVKVCPHCDRSGGVNVRNVHRRLTSADDPEQRFYCDRCGRSFDEPAERAPKRSGTYPSSGLAAALLAADPDDTGRADG